jgi:uncharacterized membrane protein
MWVSLLIVICVILTGLLAGAFFLGTVVIEPSVEGLPVEQHFLFRQQMISRMERLVPPLMGGAIIFPLLTGLVFETGWTRLLLLSGCGLSLASLILTLMVNRPINLRFLHWSAAAPPVDFMNTVVRWSRYDRVRTGMTVLAYLLTVAAAGSAA